MATADPLYYDQWVAREGLDLIRGYAVDNVYTLPLKYWARTGGNAVRIQLDGTGDLNDAYVCEIPAGRQLEPVKHVYDEMVYILAGRGSTTVWYEGKPKNSFEWHAGSLFAIPLNARYQHFNLDGSEPVRYMAVTTAPLILNIYRNDDFVFNNPATFPERYDSREDFFSARFAMRETGFRETGVDDIKVAFTNFVFDIDAIPSHKSARAAGANGRQFRMGPNGYMSAHSTTIPGRTFSTVHRHGPGFHVLWLRGEGYALMWPEAGEKVQLHWGPGSIIVPPTMWWHHWAVLSPEPAQDLALHPPRDMRSNEMGAGVMISTREGGNMVMVEDFPPDLDEEIRSLFAEGCRNYDQARGA